MEKNIKYILASTSPRRKELFKKLNVEFSCISPDYDEDVINKEFTYRLIEDIAENKNNSVAALVKEPSIIVSADTVVIFNNKVLGKPKDYNDAFKMLTMLSGNTHKVVTSVCVYNNNSHIKVIKSETSKVSFNELSDYVIDKYIMEYKPFDKAGSYGIQELPSGFVKEVEGDFDNIVGLPVEMVKQMINRTILV
ncbi:septum formation protein Maf [bacterium]|nr:septum formation protein Maf [bacterium]